MNMNARKRNTQGFTLIEVLVGIVIFALGMMALAQLQGSLARNSTDSNARTVATNIAEELIEAARTFSQITSDGVNRAYNDIVDDSQTIPRGGNEFTVVTEVTDYYYDPDTEGFTIDEPVGAARSDMKLVELTVTWNTEQEFQIDEDSVTEGRLGTGSITLRDVISSITSPSGGKVALGTNDDTSFAPPVDYNPGENPDIISIELGDNKFKESTTPLPDVIRANELVETRFDVVTYSQNDDGATFLRREEFRAVSCECTLRIPDPDGDEGGLRPTVWDGTEYTQGEWVTKPYGESADPRQSVYCEQCCRDHHDGGSGEDDDPDDPGRALYNPFRTGDDYFADGALAGDHKHYLRSRPGELILAESDGARYIEACRMVRKDGFFRIAQDLRQEGLNAFPGDYLDDGDEVGVYSDYVTEAVSDFEAEVGAADLYELTPPSLTHPHDMSPAVVFPASSWDEPTEMLEGGVTEQQLRSRGIYIDYLSDALRVKINCLDMGGEGDDCETPEVTTALEIIPFYDVQLTWLARWNEEPVGFPIEVSNEAIEDGNEHSRGVAVLEGGEGPSEITSAIHRGNLGLTGTDPIDPRYGLEADSTTVYALAGDGGVGPPLSGIIISGEILSSVPGVKAADVEIEASGAVCDRTLTGYECDLVVGAINPRLKIFNYGKGRQLVLGCSEVLDTHGVSHVAVGGENWTRFNLPPVITPGADIILRLETCD
jgi:prepilin-type N-terminal cleavage/methylation domain-containing protein